MLTEQMASINRQATFVSSDFSFLSLSQMVSSASRILVSALNLRIRICLPFLDYIH